MKLQLQIITPEKNFFSGEVDRVSFRTTEGDIGVLPNHQPLTAIISIGTIRIKQDGNERKASLIGGFAEIQPDKVTILTDAAEWPEEIDVRRAEEAKRRAEERLAKRTADINVARAESALRRALIRLELSQYNKNR
ncbi:F0F1 ATP synthase subunit epsilon [Defluviitalea raffinosedens]|uniref:F0F1 ATP synthase subunit epsilon n=1 Tax=Defluviitalea raffinosedens TaxID=1450156 RepID=UPI001956D44C|nr:F0F1 ATP synthase subunit epsilon [Defluviitalea raffinosedens]MBM7684541.1 F-type H+-transporting ATPase subunit epsilon [Defluviitalea raffinosedens]